MNPTTISEAELLPEDALERFSKALQKATVVLYPDADVPPIAFEAPRRPEFGDFATNVALQLARFAKKPPQEVATTVLERTFENAPDLRSVVSDAQAVAGFINIRLAPVCWQRSVARILREGASFGKAPANGKRISL